MVGSIGRLSAQKGYEYFVRAAAQVARSAPNAHFVLVGSGEFDAALRRLVNEHELQERFHLLGARADVEELLFCMDLFVSSSLWEGLPTVILEAMAAGIPVLATSVSGTAEVV
ncbi:glycosyltransferase, partial [Arthrospira platensis SPKY2]